MTSVPPPSPPPSEGPQHLLKAALESANLLPRSITESIPLDANLDDQIGSLDVDLRTGSFFSPTTTQFTDQSAQTNGTGATGSTEPAGEATRSLVASVERRQERVGKGSSLGDRDSWIELDRPRSGEVELGDEVSGDERLEQSYTNATKARGNQEGISLKYPQPFQRSESPVQVKREESEAGSESLPGVELGIPEEISRGVTSSQEAEGLYKSVTRSQSDFTKWLEDTMRLASGDGSSVIETDDALSSILQATRQTRFGHSLSGTEEHDRFSSYSSILEDAVPIDDTLPSVKDLSFERDEEAGDTDEDKMKPKAVEEEKIDNVEVEQAGDLSRNSAESPTSVAPPGNFRWQLLSLLLSIALTASLHRQRTLSSLIRPTPSSRFVPMVADNTTVLFSPFATPVPIADTFASPIYAIVFTILATIPASVHLFLKGRVNRAKGAQGELVSPLLELNGDAVLSARERLSLGTSHFHSRRLRLAISTFEPTLELACASIDKAVASELLGRCYYRLGRQCGNDLGLFAQARNFYERSIRLDRSRAGPRSGLGKTAYRLGDYRGAVRAFETAISRDVKVGWVHEWLGRALHELHIREGGRDGIATVEKHLVRAIELNPQSYQAQAFLGEILHQRGRSQEAYDWLTKSVVLRIDQPQVHARLGFIANERLDPILAAKHFRLVLRTRERGGHFDESCPASLEAVTGATPHLSLYFVTPSGEKEARLEVLEAAILEYPYDDLLQLLYLIALASTEPKSAVLSDPMSKLETRSQQLGQRSARFPQDTLTQGLYALSLLALGQPEQAQEVYSTFWTQVGRGSGRQGAGTNEETAAKERQSEDDVRPDKRRITFLIMAFFEIKHESARNEGKSVTAVEASPPGQVAEDVKREVFRRQKKQVVAVNREPVNVKSIAPVRRSPRLSRTN